MDSDNEENQQHSGDDELDDKLHEKLVKNVLSLSYKDYVKAPSRTEPSLSISEYDLASSKKKVHVEDLTHLLKKKGKHLQVINQISKLKSNSKPVPRPLEKVKADRIHRAVGYEKTKDSLKRWDPIVTSLRAATHVSYPLHSKKSKRDRENIIDEMPKTDLQKALENLEKVSTDKQGILPLEENEELKGDGNFPLTMTELLEKRKEDAKFRAQESYKSSKARRQNKIKSKKYHRIEKRAKLKAQMKEFETLQKSNPEAALEKLEEIERARAEERMSLRHKSTGQWAKSKAIRAKYDRESRQVLAEQLAISKDLTQKVKSIEDSDSDTEIGEEKISNGKIVSDNPWVNDSNIKVSKEVEDFVDGYRKYWEEKKEKNEKHVQEDEGNTEEILKHSSIDDKIYNSAKFPQENGLKTQKDEETLENATKNVKNTTKNVENMKNTTKNVENMKNATKNMKNTTKNVENTTKNMKNTTKNMKNTTKNVENKIKTEKSSKKNEKIASENAFGEKNEDIVFGYSGEWSVSTENQDEDFLEKEFHKLEENLRKKVEEKSKKLLEQSLHKKAQTKKPKNRKFDSKPNKSDDLTLPIKKDITRPIIDEELLESTGNSHTETKTNELLVKNLKQSKTEQQNSKNSTEIVDINPNKFLTIKTTELKSSIPDLMSFDENEEDADQRGLISEAFQNDDIVAAFRSEKDREIAKDKQEDIDLTLPGWGAWGGKNIAVSARKRKRFVLKFPEEMPRKDRNRGDLIVSDCGNAKIKPHLVSEVPFPFKNVRDYEASIRAPIGNTFVPETAFRRQIRPAIETRMGAVIEPMTEDVLLKKKKKEK